MHLPHIFFKIAKILLYMGVLMISIVAALSMNVDHLFRINSMKDIINAKVHPKANETKNSEDLKV